MDAEVVLEAKADLGEGPIWDPDRKRLVFVDIMRGHIHEFDPATRADHVVEVGRPVSVVALTTRGDWVAAAQGGFYRVNPDTGRIMQLAPLEADLPGLKAGDFNLSIENYRLTLSGERKFEKENKGDNWRRVERSYGGFTRAFSLPSTINVDEVNAEFKDGVLRVTLPKREEVKARQIQVQAPADAAAKAAEAK